MSTFRADGLDSPISPNGAHPLYYIDHVSGRRSGPYGCPREAELAMTDERDEIMDHHGRAVDTAGDPISA